ncbi:hypothetical protein HKX69_30465 [Streptomyces argyrophyllae]|uniref:Uncharacterized protein n=1 Tax=Streptomyces argyrophylli TaxID=2726118 RepID=A0A6M4PUD2_9ACTN|nr:hypothetical protein [Streptomyces argyrophyllae]QJS13296.1 hypothetical protein HKX69_30465 [Streptomyces argyrophyllae]
MGESPRDAGPAEIPERGGEPGPGGRDRVPSPLREEHAAMELRRAEQAHTESAGMVPGIHRPGGFEVDASVPSRQQCWDMLEPGLREKLAHKAGGVWEWWARPDHEGHPQAFVFGPRGLCQVGRVVRDGRTVFQGERLRVEPGSVRRRSFAVTGAGRRPSTATEPWGGAAATRAAQPSAAVRPLDLAPAAAGVLGNFPPEVQEFVQRPFLSDDHGLVADWYYEETLELTHRKVFVVFCLSAERHVTVAAGTRTLPRGRPPHQARWDVECYEALIRRA